MSWSFNTSTNDPSELKTRFDAHGDKLTDLAKTEHEEAKPYVHSLIDKIVEDRTGIQDLTYELTASGHGSQTLGEKVGLSRNVQVTLVTY